MKNQPKVMMMLAKQKRELFAKHRCKTVVESLSDLSNGRKHVKTLKVTLNITIIDQMSSLKIAVTDGKTGSTKCNMDEKLTLQLSFNISTSNPYLLENCKNINLNIRISYKDLRRVYEPLSTAKITKDVKYKVWKR